MSHWARCAAAIIALAIGLGGPTAAHAQGASAPAAVTLLTPEMDGVLAWPAMPGAIDTGPLGTWYVDGAATGLGLVQSARVPGDRTLYGDASNAQVFIQKIDGFLQFYAQAGFYTIPGLGTPYTPFDTSHAIHNTYGAIPQAFIKLAPTADFSIEAGKLPTLIGPESTFTFENMNIERGLLWNQEPSVSRGVQANETVGPVAFNISLNDGYYSNRFNWVSGSASWTINAASTLTIDGGGNLGHTAYQTNAFATPIAQNNSTMVNIAYTYKAARWIVTPNVQYNVVPADALLGFVHAASSYGAAILASYAFTDRFSLAGRVEFLATDGRAGGHAINLLYGPGSNAASLTITPTFKLGRYYLRGEVSCVYAGSITEGDAFGAGGGRTAQWRGLLEGGALF